MPNKLETHIHDNTCVVCGTQYKGYRASDKYCSRKCNIKSFRKNNPKKHARWIYEWRIRQYGLTVEQYEKMCDDLDGRCQICQDKLDYRLHIDHCHDSNEVRGLLCRECNLGLGQFKDNPGLLKEAAEYLYAAV